MRARKSLALPVLIAALVVGTALQGAFYQPQLILVAGLVAGGVIIAGSPRLPPLVLAGFGVLVIGLFASAAVNGADIEMMKPALTLAIAFGATLLAARAATIDGPETVVSVVVWIAVGFAVLGIVGVVAHIDELALRSEPWRLTSTLTYQNAAAALLVLALPPALLRAVRGTLHHRIAAALIAGALVMTFSRGGWLAAAISIVTWVFLARPPRRVFLGLGAAGGALVAAALLYAVAVGAEGRLSASWMDRDRVWAATLDQVDDHRWFGTGPGTYELVAPREGKLVRTAFAHNEYLQTLSETGIVGLASVLAAIALFCAVARSAWRSTPTQCAAAASCIGFLAESAFDFLWRFPVLVMLVFTLFACMISHSPRTHEATP